MISDLIIHGTAKNLDKIKASLQEQYPNVNFNRFKPLDMIIAEAGGDIEGLQAYAIAKLDKEIFEWNRAHPNEKGTINSWKNYIPMARVFDENENFGFLSSLKGEKTGSERDTSKVDAKNHIIFYENGKRKYLQTAPEVVRAIAALGERTESVMIVKLLHAATKAVTASYTTLNLDFAADNPFRDLADSYLHNKHIGKNPLPFIINPFSAVLEGLQRVAEHGEQAVRLANYRAARDALAKQRADGKATVEDKRKAALISREASIDFAGAFDTCRQPHFRLYKCRSAELESRLSAIR